MKKVVKVVSTCKKDTINLVLNAEMILESNFFEE